MQVSGAGVAAKASEVCGMAFLPVPQHVTARFSMRPQCLSEDRPLGNVCLVKAGMARLEAEAMASSQAFPQMTVRAWFGRKLDHGGAGGGAQDARGARVGVLSQPGLEGVNKLN